MLNDSQIAMASDAGHNAAIDQARIAFTKTKNQRVRKFAQMALADHGKAKEELTALLVELRVAPQESDLSTQIGVASGQALFSMREATTNDFDRKYIAAQVAAHENFMSALDERLIPNAGNARLKELLMQFRAREKAHLDEVREIKEELGSEVEMEGTVPVPPTVPTIQ
jgi:putative membrane protein